MRRRDGVRSASGIEFTVSRRLLHLGLLLAAIAIVTFASRSWIAAAAMVPILGLLLWSLVETLLPLPVSASRSIDNDGRMLLDDRTEATVAFRSVPLPWNIELKDGIPEGLKRSDERTRPDRDRARFRYTLEALRRGAHTFTTARIVRRGWLGLVSRTAVLPVTTQVEVLPASAQNLRVQVRPRPPDRSGLATKTARPGSGDEFFALRPYRPGDDLGDINWKATARTGRIITNEYLPEEPPRYLVYVDTRSISHEEGQKDAFERSMEATGVLVEALFQARAHVGLVTLSSHCMFLAPSGGQGQLDRLRAMVQGCRPGDNGPLFMFMQASWGRIPMRTDAILITSDIYDPTLEDTLFSLRVRHGRTILLVPGFPMDDGEDLDTVSHRAAGAILNMEQQAMLARLAGLIDHAVQWPPDEPISITLARTGLIRGAR